MSEKIDVLKDSIRNYLQMGRSFSEIERLLRVLASDEEITEAVALVKDDANAKQDVVTVLTDSQHKENWYYGPNQSPTSHWSLLTETLRNKSTRPWTAEMVQNLDFASTDVVANLADPKTVKPRKVRGLVLGYVQSGKTANFSASIAKSVDAGYKLIVVLAGVHNILRKQTQARLYEEIVRPKASACTTLTTVDENGDFQRKQPVSPNRALGAGDGFTLVVLKKNASVLRNFTSWLETADNGVLDNCPTLIIDDESDQASVNTNKPEDDPTAINGYIRDIIKKFKVLSYVGYTATPFANVLIDLSIEDDLFPKDFIVALDKPHGYVGTEELFGRDAIEPHGALNGLPVIRNIPENDAVRFVVKKKKNKNDKDSEIDEGIPASLFEALDSFLLGSVARLCRGQWKQHMTMLIHTSHLVAKHQALLSGVEDWVKTLKLDRTENSEELRSRLKLLWEKDFVTVTANFKAAKVVSFEQIWKTSEKLIDRLEVVMENHASEERLTYERPDPFWGIVIGGNTLSRGLTIEGLTTSYFVRGSKGYDTLLQMGRWFGFRPDYVDLTRIYVTEDLESKFYHLATVELEIRHEIRAMAANKERPCDVGLRIRTHPNMEVTSRLKMRLAKNDSLTYSASKVQALYVNLSDRSILTSNLDATIKLLDSIEKYNGSKRQVEFEDLNASLLYQNVSSELILQFLDRFHFSNANMRFSPKMIKNYIQDLSATNELKSWSVAVISPKNGERLNLGASRDVNMVERSLVKLAKSDEDQEARHIKVITAPRDELIDLADCLPKKVRITEELFKEADGFTEVAYRSSFRPKDRGLLLLYPINPGDGIGEEEYATLMANQSVTIPLKAVAPVIGVAMVFPKTDNSKSLHRYVVNRSV